MLTERIFRFTATALPTSVKTIKFGDKKKVKSVGTDSLLFPYSFIDSHNHKTAVRLTPCAYCRSSLVRY